MSCPRCSSDDLWDDNLWWGCNYCGWAMGPDGPTMFFAKDKPGLARHLKDIPTPMNIIRVVPDDNNSTDT